MNWLAFAFNFAVGWILFGSGVGLIWAIVHCAMEGSWGKAFMLSWLFGVWVMLAIGAKVLWDEGKEER